MKYDYKYMRTKNGISEIRSKMIFNSVKEYVLGNTIEELCDEFVVASNTPLVKMNPKIQKNMEFEEISQTYVKSKKNSIVYGAIWTDKGLIYVAKMDADGKLVLI